MVVQSGEANLADLGKFEMEQSRVEREVVSSIEGTNCQRKLESRIDGI